MFLGQARPLLRRYETVELSAFLRTTTREHHQRLEESLELLRTPISKQRFVHVLERLHGFHAVWEGAVTLHGRLRVLCRSRSRVPHLRRDLQALGRTAREIEGLPLCARAAALADTEAAAIGSLYVLEGSTLGGRIIGRALSQEPWLPDGGLSYFDPYGHRTGPMWLSFRQWLDESGSGHDRHAIAAGAQRTFSLLQDWLGS